MISSQKTLPAQPVAAEQKTAQIPEDLLYQAAKEQDPEKLRLALYDVQPDVVHPRFNMSVLAQVIAEKDDPARDFLIKAGIWSATCAIEGYAWADDLEATMALFDDLYQNNDSWLVAAQKMGRAVGRRMAMALATEVDDHITEVELRNSVSKLVGENRFLRCLFLDKLDVKLMRYFNKGMLQEMSKYNFPNVTKLNLHPAMVLSCVILAPDDSSNTAIIDGFARAGNSDFLIDFLEKIILEQRTLLPEPIELFYNAAFHLSLCEHQNAIDKLKAFFLQFAPDLNLSDFNQRVIAGRLARGDLSNTMALMPRDEYDIDRIFVQKMASFIYKAGYIARTIEFIELAWKNNAENVLSRDTVMLYAEALACCKPLSTIYQKYDELPRVKGRAIVAIGDNGQPFYGTHVFIEGLANGCVKRVDGDHEIFFSFITSRRKNFYPLGEDPNDFKIDWRLVCLFVKTYVKALNKAQLSLDPALVIRVLAAAPLQFHKPGVSQTYSSQQELANILDMQEHKKYNISDLLAAANALNTHPTDTQLRRLTYSQLGVCFNRGLLAFLLENNKTIFTKNGSDCIYNHVIPFLLPIDGNQVNGMVKELRTMRKAGYGLFKKAPIKAILRQVDELEFKVGEMKVDDTAKRKPGLSSIS